MKATKWIYLAMIIIILLTAACAALIELPEAEMPATSVILDINGQVISSVFEQQHRIPVNLDEISPYFLKAIISIEDHRFFQHHGIDLQAIARAFLRNLRARTTLEGGSTITQQTAKVLFLSPERTYSRKLKEALLTIQLERQYTKREILERYVNLIYYGHGAYGIETAAQTYFNKSAKDLDLSESAILAGLVRGPAFYSPFTRPEAAKARQSTVLTRMVELEVITEAEAAAALDKDLNLAQERGRFRQAPYFTSMVIEYVTENFDDGADLLYRGGLEIHTTLDLQLQRAAEQAFSEGLANWDPELEGAFVAIDPNTGYIKAMVGGRNFSRSQVNRALTARRQPGSAFKPFLYAAAIDRGYTGASVIEWEPVSYQLPNGNTWEPTEFGGRTFPNQNFTLKTALAVSSNVIAAKLVKEITPEELAAYAKRMGINSPLRPFLSLALGTSEVNPLEITSAYGTFATNGVKAEPIFIREIRDQQQRVIMEKRPNLQVAINEKTAYILTDMMTAVIQPGGTAGGVAAIINRPGAGKTGTTNDFRDAWFIGYTPDIVAGVYIGYDDFAKSVGASGGSIAAPIWANFIAKGYQDVPAKEFRVPEGIIHTNICSDTGMLATAQCPSAIQVAFVVGSEPTEPCPWHRIRQRVVPPSQEPPEQRPNNLLEWFFNW